MSLDGIWFIEWFGLRQPKPPALPAPEAASVLAACLAKARQRFFEPSDLPYVSLFVAADVTAGKLTPQECMSLLIETRDDIRAKVYAQARRFRPADTSAPALTHSFQCLASLILEYHLREDAELVDIQEVRRSKMKWPPLYPAFAYPIARDLALPEDPTPAPPADTNRSDS